MECPRCHTELPEVAHFCHRCGKDERSTDEARRNTFAVKPDEPVASFALISTIMPRGAGERPQTYRWALVGALVIALLAALFGALPIAVVVAAFAIPLVYIVYLYDVNLWDDHPVQVTVMAFVLTFVTALGFSALWWHGLGGGSGIRTTDLLGMSVSAPTLSGFLLVALLVPLVGELLRQIGPIVLTSRPRYDDLLDGVSFGVVSGVAFAAADTLIRHGSLITGGLFREVDPGLWMALIFLEGFVKPLVLGTATGIAVAEFAGLGKGYDGFSTRYLRGLGEAIGANALYFGGIYLLSFLTDRTLSVVLSIIWGLLILGALMLRMRSILHLALIETALSDAQAQAGLEEREEHHFCHQCEMPLMPRAAFCTACGVAVSTRHKDHHDPRQQKTASPAPQVPAGSEGEQR